MQRCQRPTYDAVFLLGGAWPKSTGPRRLELDRLSTRYVYLVAQAGDQRDLEVSVDLPDRTRGGEASIIKTGAGPPQILRIRLNASGNGSRTFDYVPTADNYLVLSNTGRHNNETYRYRARVVPEP